MARGELKKIRDPSADHLGWESSPGASVNCRTSLPSAAIAQISISYGNSASTGRMAKAIVDPSGENTAPLGDSPNSGLSSSTRWLVPSEFMIQIACRPVRLLVNTIFEPSGDADG